MRNLIEFQLKEMSINKIYHVNIDTYSLNNLNNFELDDYLKICKKITDDDWVDKDGNHYTNNGFNKKEYAIQRLREERKRRRAQERRNRNK